MKQFLKVVFELGPLAVFFVSNAYYGLMTATGAFMVAITVALLANWVLFRKVAAMALVTAVFVLVFGGLTLYLNDATFIKMKPTIVNLLFASLLLGGLFFGRPLLKLLFDDAFHLSDEGWHKLTLRWGLFFIVLALLNEFVWRNFSDDAWVNFKVFGIMPLTFLFGMAQLGILTRYQLDPEQDGEGASSAQDVQTAPELGKDERRPARGES